MQRRFGVHRPRAAIRTRRSPGDKTGSKDAIGWQVHPISIALNILNFDAARLAASGFDCGAAVRARSKYQEIFQ
jgi:hypothetical protein